MPNLSFYNKDGTTLLHTGMAGSSSYLSDILSESWNTYGITEVSYSIGGNPISSNTRIIDLTGYTLYDVTEPETITGFFLDGQEYQFAGGGGGGGGHDYSWETKTITSGAVELGLRTIVEPTSNFTLNAPSDLQDGMEYVLRCVNGSTAYTLTLGTGFVNDFGTDLTLHANHSDQFTFVAYNGSLELQPSYVVDEGQGGEGTLVTTPGIYRDKKNGLISISSNGSTWMTIADKNLGATVVLDDVLVEEPSSSYQRTLKINNKDYLSKDIYGYYFQRGRNYKFILESLYVKKIQATYKGRYGNSFLTSGTNGDWLATANADLWGGTTATNIARRGPCPEGWHVPYSTEISNLDTILSSLGISGLLTRQPANAFRLLKLTPVGEITVDWSSSNKTYEASIGGSSSYNTINVPYADYNGLIQFRVCEQGNSTNYGRAYSSDDDGEGDPGTLRGARFAKTCGLPIRPFKNEGVQPTTTWEVLYQSS